MQMKNCVYYYPGNYRHAIESIKIYPLNWPTISANSSVWQNDPTLISWITRNDLVEYCQNINSNWDFQNTSYVCVLHTGFYIVRTVTSFN